MIGVKYDIIGYRGLKYRIRKERLAGPMRRFFHDCGQTIADNARANTTPNIWRSDVISSIDYEVDKSSPPWYVHVFAGSAHAEYLEMGTSAGYFPNIDNLSEYTDNPWAMGAHIEAVGTKAYPFLEPAAWESVPALQMRVAGLAVDIEMTFAAG